MVETFFSFFPHSKQNGNIQLIMVSSSKNKRLIREYGDYYIGTDLVETILELLNKYSNDAVFNKLVGV